MAQEPVHQSSSLNLAQGCTLLVYCSKCQFLIPPSKKPASSTPEGVFCETCVPDAVPVARKKRGSSILLKPDAHFLKSVADEQEKRRAVATINTAKPRSSKTWLYAGIGAGAGLALLLLGLLLTAPTKPKGEKVATAAPTPTPTLQTRTPEPVPTPVSASESRPPILETPKPETTLSEKAPSAAAPLPTSTVAPIVEAPPAVVAVEPTPPAVAGASLPLPTPVGPARNFDAEQKQFNTDLAEIREWAKDKLSLAAARDRINPLKDKYKDAPWWAASDKDYLTLKDSLQDETQDYLEPFNKIKEALKAALTIASVDKLQGDWCTKAKGLSSNEGWVVLQPTSFKALGNATMTVRNDGAVLVGGPSSTTDTFLTQYDTTVSGITAIRLEALPDPSLPNNGPGRSDNGNLVLTNLELRAQRGSKPGEPLEVVLTKARATHSQDNYSIEHAIDRNAESGWALVPKMGQPNTAIFEFATPLPPSAWTRLCLTLEHNYGGKHNLGCYRLSATTSPTPSAIAFNAPTIVEAQLGKNAPDAYIPAVFSMMKAADKRRAEIAETQHAENTRRLYSLFSRAESAAHTLPGSRETLAKVLDEAEGLMLLDADLAKENLEKLGAFRFDVDNATRSDAGILRGDGSMVNNLLEVTYDFSKHQRPDVYAGGPPWYPFASWDEKKGLLNVRCDGKRFWFKGTWNNMPEFHAGFNMLPDTFMVETTGTITGWTNPKNPNGGSTDTGIYVYGGDRQMIMLGIQVQDDRSVKVVLSGSTPKIETINEAVKFIPNWKANEPVKLQLVCVNGVIQGVASARGQSVTVEGKTMNFKPFVAGFYARTYDDGFVVQGAYQYLKIRGVPDREKLKAIIDNERAAYARNYMLKMPGSK